MNEAILYKFVRDVCNILNIKIPVISYDTSHFTSSTMFAQCDSTGTTIYINSKIQDIDIYFSVAHELRHIYQIRTNYDLYFSEYITNDNCPDVDTYNMQLAELDANAFAYMIMVDFFHRKPLFKGFSDSVKNAIADRVKYLSEKEF